VLASARGETGMAEKYVYASAAIPDDENDTARAGHRQ
jgi:hypothetical protein